MSMQTEPSPPLSLDELIDRLREVTGPTAEDAPRDTQLLLQTRELVEQEPPAAGSWVHEAQGMRQCAADKPFGHSRKTGD